MLAMTAARVGEPEKAVDALFLESPKNRYLANGHNYQSARLPLYLPGNGGLLSAVAMMAAGWDGWSRPAGPRFSRQWQVESALGRPPPHALVRATHAPGSQTRNYAFGVPSPLPAR